MRWLITGGCGFIGVNLLRRLLSEGGHKIRVVDNFSVGTRTDLETALGERARYIELVEVDIRDEAAALRASEGVEVIAHLAANTGVAPSVEDPRADCVTNVMGTLNYLEACRLAGVARFVLASSGAPVGECEPPLHEEVPPHPVSPYGASKLAGEAYCSAYKRSFGIDTVALRFGNCYGPYSRRKSSVVAKFIREALDGRTWEIYGDGAQTRDFIYVDDVVEAICCGAGVAGIGGEVFQIATNVETTVAEMADVLALVLRRHGLAPRPPVFVSPRAGDVRRNYSDTSKARRRLGWTTSMTLETGLQRTVDWFLRQQLKPE